MKGINVVYIGMLSLVLGCNSKTNEEVEDNSREDANIENKLVNTETSACGLENGTHSATVDYNNSETGYSSTYKLDVEVEDCRVVQITFPNGGYVDGDHIAAADIDEDGNASIDGEDGKSYEVRIED